MGTRECPSGAGSEKNWGSLGHGPPGLGWQQDRCGPFSEEAPERPGDNLGCSTTPLRQVYKDGVLAAASLQYPDVCVCFSVVLHLDQQMKKWMLLQTIHAHGSVGH